MLRIDRNGRALQRIETRSLGDAGLRERADIQAMLVNSWPMFTAELGEDLLLLGQEISPSDSVADRIDVLALDEQGSLVVVELKRGSHRLQLLQAIAYAGMIMRWPAKRITETLAATDRSDQAAAEEKLEEFLGGNVAGVNRRQRVLLLAEGFDAAVLAAAEWLSERHMVDIRCHRLSLFSDCGADYLGIVQVYPPPPAIGEARAVSGEGFADWEAMLRTLLNPELAAFVKGQIGKPGRRDKFRQGTIRLWRGGRRLFYIGIKREFARVVQVGRFDDDIQFWRSRLSPLAGVAERNGRSEVTFRLRAASDFEAFDRAFDIELAQTAFRYGPASTVDDDEDTNEDDDAAEPT